MAGHAALPDAEKHGRIRDELGASIEQDMAEATAGDDANHDGRNQSGFIESMLEGGQTSTPPA